MNISVGCKGVESTLIGDEGHVGMIETLYKNNAYCQWHIIVGFGKVSIPLGNLFPIQDLLIFIVLFDVVVSSKL